MLRGRNPSEMDVRPQETVPKPKLRWEKQSYSMEEILQKFSFPLVVQCQTVLSDMTREKSNFDFIQPMLLYSKRSGIKVIAQSLDLNKVAKTATEVGDQLLIPQDYKGWFAVLDHKKCNAPIPHYRQVDMLSQSDCLKFLIGGVENVEAVQRMKGLVPVPRYLYPGEVLKMGNTYVAMTQVNSKFGRSQKEVKFLLCTDQNDREVLLPFESRGLFYIIKNKRKRLPMPIMQMQDIINSVQFPCVVKLLFGRTPSTPCTFTGLMVLKNCFEESSAIASSIVNLRNILLEIPSDIPMRFKIAQKDTNLEANKGYKDAIRLCEDRAEIYKRNIKVSQGIVADDGIPDTSAPPPPVCLSQAAANPEPEPVPQLQTNHSGAFAPVAPPNIPPKTFPSGGASAPPPPPQSSKPIALERVVMPTFAPPPMKVPNKTDVKSVPKDTSTGDNYEQVWITKVPKKKKPPATPPKPSGKRLETVNKIQREKSTRISINNGYLTVPIYLTPAAPDTDDTPLNDGLSDKISFWKNLERQSQAIVSRDQCQTGKSENRNSSFTYPEPKTNLAAANSKNNAGIIYENIEDLRPITVDKSQSLYVNHDATLDDVPYELPSLQPTSSELVARLDEVTYEDPMCVIPGNSSEPYRGQRVNTVVQDARVSVTDSGINMEEDEEPDVVSSRVVQMTVKEVCEGLKALGVKKKTVEFLKKEKVDGRFLAAFDEKSLKSAYPKITEKELQKIRSFVKGVKS